MFRRFNPVAVGGLDQAGHGDRVVKPDQRQVNAAALFRQINGHLHQVEHGALLHPVQTVQFLNNAGGRLDLEAMAHHKIRPELIAVWNAEKSPTREFVCKLLVLLTDPTSDFAGFLQREGKRIAEHDFARQVAVQRAGTSQPIKEEPYEKQLYYTPEQRKARQKARSQQLASPPPGQIIDVDELEEGEVKSRPSSATTIMEQAAASKGDLDLRVEQARAARQQQQQLQSLHGQPSHEQQFSQSQQFPRHPQPPTFRLQQPQWRSPPRQQQQQDQRPAYQQEQRPSGYYQQKYHQKK